MTLNCSRWCMNPWPTRATWTGDSNRRASGNNTMRDTIAIFSTNNVGADVRRLISVVGMFRASSRRLLRVLAGLALFGGSACLAETAATNTFPVTITVDATKTRGELKPIWRFFGADEPNYAYMKHGQKLVGELGELAPKQTYFRAHNLLTSGDGTPALKWGSTGAYGEDADGKPIYDWTIVDRIFDTYLERDVRPYAQIGFMPKEFSVKPEP